jgi:hypothetical protein
MESSPTLRQRVSAGKTRGAFICSRVWPQAPQIELQSIDQSERQTGCFEAPPSRSQSLTGEKPENIGEKKENNRD